MPMPSIPSPTQPALPSASLPAITPRAHPSPPPSRVVVDLTTLLTISDFSVFYPDASPNAFQPVYYALADGSLVAPPFRNDLTVNNVALIITGCLLSIFFRNVCIAAIYLWRGKVKKKGLLCTLFLSQLLGPIAIIPIIVAQFSRSASCAVILRITFIASGISLSLLVTGIFGVKAYRCLDNNRLVSGVLAVLRTAGTVVLLLDVINIHTFRTLSGRCHRPSTGLSSAFVVLLLTESLFICACFLYTVRKSHGPVAVRGRISVPLSLDDPAYSQPVESRKESILRNRGFWSDARPHIDHPSISPQTSPLSREPSIMSIAHDESHGTHNYNTSSNTQTARNSKRPHSLLSTMPAHPRSPPSWTVRIPTTTYSPHLPESVATPSTCSARFPVIHFARYIPMMSLFREVMRDELCYTAITTAFTVVSATMSFVGFKSTGGIDITIWVALDWALISLLVMHSFGRAIRRHEDESLLLYPSTRYHDLHTDRTTAEFLGDAPQPVRIPGMLSRARVRRSAARPDLAGGALPLSTRHLFAGSAHSSWGDLHSLAASASGASNIFPSIETESFSRTQVSSTIYMEDAPSRTQKSTEEWFDKDSFGAPPPPEPPDERGSCDTSFHVSY